MTPDIIIDLLVLFGLLVLSGFFSSAETALFSIGKVKARHIAKSNRKTDQLISQMKEDEVMIYPRPRARDQGHDGRRAQVNSYAARRCTIW